MRRERAASTLIPILLLLCPLAHSDSGLWPSSSRPSAAQSPFSNAGGLIKDYLKSPLSFEPNQGQTNKRVRFLARGSGFSLFLTKNQATFVFRHYQDSDRPLDLPRRSVADASTRIDVLRMKLVDLNSDSSIRAENRLPSTTNYFVGHDRQQWRTGILEYEKVRYQEVYPGVDLVYYGNQQELEYDFVVAPKRDPHRIRFQIIGAKHIAVDAKGDLVLDMGQRAIRWRKPTAYQQKDGSRLSVEARYVITRRNSVAFEFSSYDRSRPLVIDPVLLYSTYLGGTGYDGGQSIAVDGSGNAYVAGYTASVDFPSLNSLQSCSTTCGDAFVTKISPAGELQYSTFLGGSKGTSATGIAVDVAGNAYVTGWTQSTDFPVVNAIQPACGGDCFDSDAFVSMLAPSGSALVYSTYLGGSGTDISRGIAVDAAGNGYITGYTNSEDFPVASPLQPACVNCGAPDYYSHAFVAEIASAGSGLVYSTYLGGSGDDAAKSIAVDGTGDAFVTGRTSSTDFPTVNPYQQSCSVCSPENLYTAFVTKVGPSGSSLLYSTYLGGSAGDQGNGIALDASGNAYVTGFTNSNDFPVVDPIETKPTGGVTGQDAFITKLDSLGSTLLYSTYLGGNEPDSGQGITVDGSGNAYVTGWTQSSDFPVASPIQSIYNGGAYDAFVTELNAAGSSFIYSTYLGGTEADQAQSIAVDGAGNVYVTGSTTSTNFPSIDSVQPENAGGGGDAFIVKISPGITATTVSLTPLANPAILGQTVALTATITSQYGGTPTGTVTFFNGTTAVATVPVTGGEASYDKTFSDPGTKSMSAVYSGDANFLASTSPILYEGVGGYPSVATLGVGVTPSVVGQNVVFTATVFSTYGVPTGVVTFMNGENIMGTSSLTNGVAIFNKAFNSAGTKSVTAIYSGDVSFAGSTSPVLCQDVLATLTVTLSGTGMGLVSSADEKINCTSAGGSGCTASYPAGTSVSLIPAPGVGSTFLWSVASDGTSLCSGSATCTLTINANSIANGLFLIPLAGTIPASPTFSIDYSSTTPFPSGISHGQGRLWDTPGVEWSYLQTSACASSPCPSAFSWNALDSLLSTMEENSVYAAQYSLARTPSFLSSNPADTACNYQDHGGPGQCDAPSDLNPDGTGADLIWRNWVAAISSHVNAPGYTSTHAHVQYWEIWNEPDTPAFWGGSSPSAQGTFDQLVRMEEDAYCIVKGGTFTNDYTGESCSAILATVTSVPLTAPTDPTASIVMPSYHGGSASLALAGCFLYGTGASNGICQGRSSHYGGAGAAHTDAINFHMKPGSSLSSQLDSWISGIQQILAAPELLKPFYNTEGGYSGQGWTAPFNTPDMEEAYVGQFYIYSIYKGISNIVWYNYASSHGGIGDSAPPNDANTAYSNVYNWLVGSAIPVCTVGSDGVNSVSLYTCATTLSNGVAAQIMWDSDPSMYCSASGCPTLNQTVSSSNITYRDLAGNKSTIVNSTVPVGIKPILVQAQQ